jgi:hypothetical protein
VLGVVLILFFAYTTLNATGQDAKA